MRARQSQRRSRLPRLWLVSDARNDAVLERALAALPRGSGLVFRHYHLAPAERAARLRRLRRLCRAHGHAIALAGKGRFSPGPGGAMTYGPPRLGPGPHLAAVHSLREIGAANRSGAALVLLSPVFATRSHPGGPALGPVRFLLLARRAAAPVLALGGMDPRAARRLPGFGWAAIDGLSHKTRGNPLDS